MRLADPKAREKRNALMVKMRREGATLDVIGAVVDLSHERCSKILRSHGLGGIRARYPKRRSRRSDAPHPSPCESGE